MYLPLFILFPSYYFWKVAALPPITVGQSALIPIGIAILLKLMPRWRWTTADLWIALFMLSTCVTDYRNGHTTGSIFDLFNNLVEGVIPYMIGKTLIEQAGLRLETARRVVKLMIVCALISFYEYRMSINPFTLVWGRFFPNESFAWKTQLRWGFGRVSGPYGQSELAGLVILFAIMLAVWLAYAKPWPEKLPWFNHPLNVKTLIFMVLFVFLFTTQARGPWLGCVFALPIAFIGKSKRIWRNSLLFALVALPLLGVGYVAAKKFVSDPNPASNEAQTAQYRQQLLDNYIPIAKQGGAFGWGQDFPRAPGQDSIDNEYLFVWLVQGWVGAGAMCLLAAECLVRLILAAVVAKNRMDRFFAYSLFGAFAGILLTIATVFLGNQPYQLFFLIAGWSQVLNRVNPVERHLEFNHVLA
ncbi:MAG: O-antigen ligase family protein [Acidobacteriaceae bacterium]|nr:O-antigen ligase family protein [Acidobacteriaceae bacterium]